jgi:hypothetical protein
MGTLNRRDVVKRAAGLAVVGAGGMVTWQAVGQEPKPGTTPLPADPEKTKAPAPPPAAIQWPNVTDDPLLERAMECPFTFMFVEEAVIAPGADTAMHDVVFVNARTPRTTTEGVRLRSMSMVVFRADAGRDDFTKQGGIYWRCDTAEGKLQFKATEGFDQTADSKPRGPLVLAVRNSQGEVRCYRLMIDLRC